MFCVQGVRIHLIKSLIYSLNIERDNNTKVQNINKGLHNIEDEFTRLIKRLAQSSEAGAKILKLGSLER